MKKLIIFGNSPLAKLIHFFFTRDSKYEVVAFTVDKEFLKEDTFCGLPVIPFDHIQNEWSPMEYDMFVAVGPKTMNTLREKKFDESKEKGYFLASYISPNSVCNSPIGENSFIGDFVSINPFCQIGFDNFFWEGSIILSDATVYNHCYFSPRAILSPYSVVYNNCIVGAGSIVKSNTKVLMNTLIGANCYLSIDSQENAVFGVKSTDCLGLISKKVDITI